MSRRVGIAPSILSADFGKLAEEVRAVQVAGADWIHVDVMDGHFVPNITIGPGVTRAVRRATDLPVDVHLMIEHPKRYIADFIDAGADRITVHAEACPHLHRVVHAIREQGALPGVAINPATPVSVLSEILDDVDLVLIMTVNPGFGGQRFIPGSLRKLEELSALLRASGRQGDVEIQVDGGVDPSTAPGVVEVGATSLVAGSAVYGAPDGPAAAIDRLREAIASAGVRRA